SYLSGGMDSGSITAVGARHIKRLHTFSGGFDLSSASGLELNFDERPAAEVISNLLKTEHYEIVMHAGDMEHVLPELIWHRRSASGPVLSELLHCPAGEQICES